jgi:hypothetical protein
MDTPAADAIATAEIGPNLHDLSTSIEAIRTTISSLHCGPNLMAQRFLQEIARKKNSTRAVPRKGSFDEQLVGH